MPAVKGILVGDNHINFEERNLTLGVEKREAEAVLIVNGHDEKKIWGKMVKEAVENVVARKHVESEAEQILISTAALLCDFLHSKKGRELCIRLREQQKDVGFFFPPLVEAILDWEKEGRNEGISGIRELAGKVREL